MVNHITAAIRDNKKASILAPIFVCFEVLFEVLIPVVMAILIDKGIDAGDQGEILRLGGILIVMAVCALIFGVLAGGAAADASAGLARNLRHDIYHHVQNFSFANIDKFSTAGIVTRLTTDVTNVQNAYQMIIRVAVRAPVMLVFAFAMTVYISPRLATIYLCAIPILGIGLALIISRVHGLFTQVFDTYDELNNVVQENLTGIRVVKSFVREDFEKKKFGTISEKLFRGFLKAERLIILNMPLMQFCVYACPVSYTHLDVYKRQVVTRQKAGKGTDHECDADRPEIGSFFHGLFASDRLPCVCYDTPSGRRMRS